MARPFPKFFNYGEGERYPSPGARPVLVTEKVDGSLGIGYFHAGQWYVATRGSFTSDQAIRATQLLHEKHRGLHGFPVVYTPLLEIVYPENRVVSNYGDREALVLLAINYICECRELPFFAKNDWGVANWGREFGFDLPAVYPSNTLEDVHHTVASLEENAAIPEGVVTLFSDGQRFKFETRQYVQAAEVISNIVKRGNLVVNVAEAMRGGFPLDDLIALLPGPDRRRVEEARSQIALWVRAQKRALQSVFSKALLSGNSRKDFALYISRYPPKSAIFSLPFWMAKRLTLSSCR